VEVLAEVRQQPLLLVALAVAVVMLVPLEQQLLVKVMLVALVLMVALLTQQEAVVALVRLAVRQRAVLHLLVMEAMAYLHLYQAQA
jgi:hypothetical protein